jgi:hypothetical protein
MLDIPEQVYTCDIHYVINEVHWNKPIERCIHVVGYLWLGGYVLTQAVILEA